MRSIMKRRCIIVDLDGTLFNHSARVHLAVEKDWDEYHARADEDTIHEPVAAIVKRMAAKHIDIIYCTGRPQKYETVTRNMLAKYGMPLDGLLMRRDGDTRSDVLVKRSHLSNIEQEVFFVLEDRKRVTKMWREEGLFVLQCAEGDF